MKFTEAQLEAAIIELLGEQGFPYVPGGELTRCNTEVLINDDLRQFLSDKYQVDNITTGEIDSIIKQIESLPASDLYDSNKTLLTEQERKKIKPMERVKMVMTRCKDDPKELWDLLGTKEYHKELDRQFKNEKSNFKIAVCG